MGLERFLSFRHKKKRDSTVNGDSSSPLKNGESSTAEPKTNGVNAGGLLNGLTKSKSEAQGRYPDPPDHGTDRPSITEAMNAFVGVISHSMRPLPEQTADGTYAEEEVHASMFKELSTIGLKDIKTLKDKIENGKAPIDDKTMLMEKVIQLVADLPDKSIHRNQLTNTFVDQLFNSLQHPPLSYLGDQFRYRQADGSYNNIMYPHIGAANTPYARTVAPETVQTGALPDPGLIFDSLFARGKFIPHPNNNSSVIFYWASIIIHDLFQTDHHDFNNSQTSSYLDLSPLYGDTQDDQDQIRTFKDGKIKPDCFAEHRLLTFPPGCGVILIMFNRFHNYVAEQLPLINENGRFTKPAQGLSADQAEKAWKKYDNDLFQTARLVTGGLYMNIMLIDYVRTIINLNRSNTTWTLDPRVKESNTAFDDTGSPRGIGNQVSAEFNLVYRWHSAISERDDQWTQDLFKSMFGKDASEISMPEMLGGLSKWAAEMPKDPHQREFRDNAGKPLKRDADGKFDDDELVEIITSSVEDVAGTFGANHVPKVLRAVEILGMKQARAWDCASLNEFRKFFGLTQHKTFESINPDPKVAEQLRNLYEHPDRVELYPGIVSENCKLPIPKSEGGPVGVGICPSYTISRAILSDAVALVRGDRFYTVDYHPKALTNWGYSEVQYDFNVNQGCTFSKLFLRAFPNHFEPNSIYAHYPMTIPSENRKIMKDLGRENHFSWERPKRRPTRVLVQSYSAVKKILEDQQQWKVIWGDAFEYLYGPGGRKFMLSGDTPAHLQNREVMKESLYHDVWHKQVKEFYEYITIRLLREKSKKIAGHNQIDISRDVGNLTHVHFVANVFSLPLKTAEHPRGVYSEHELYLVLAAMFILIFFDVDPVKTFPLALASRTVTQQLGKLVEANVKFVGATGWLSGITDKFYHEKNPLTDYGVHMVKRLLATGKSANEVTWENIIGTAGAMVGNQATVFTQILDFYLQGPGKQYWPDVQAVAQSGDSEEVDEKILKYAMEGIRLNTTFASYRQAQQAEIIDDVGFAGKIHVKPSDRIFVSFVKASRDPEIFPEPMTVRLDRPLESYIHYGFGVHQCLGKQASRVALTAMLKTVARLKNLRPAPGPQGVLKKVDKGEGFYAYMTESWDKFFPFPTTWKLHFDGELPELPTYKP